MPLISSFLRIHPSIYAPPLSTFLPSESSPTPLDHTMNTASLSPFPHITLIVPR